MFNLLKDKWAALIASYTDFNLLSFGDNVAKYKLGALKNGLVYYYEISFVKGENGIWYILEY